eukprot:655634-Prorocentrum_minimum.AAC.1
MACRLPGGCARPRGIWPPPLGCASRKTAPLGCQSSTPQTERCCAAPSAPPAAPAAASDRE